MFARNAGFGRIICCCQVYFFIASLSRKTVRHKIQILLDHRSLVKLKCCDSLWTWGLWAVLPWLLFSFWWKKKLCSLSFSFSLLFFALRFTLLAHRLCCCDAAGADAWKWLFGAEYLICRGFTSDCLHCGSRMLIRGWSAAAALLESVSRFPFTKRESS